MALEPALVLSAVNPFWSGYDPASPTAPHVNAALFSFGGFTMGVSPYGVSDQVSNDELIIGYDPADPADENDLTSINDDICRRSAISVAIHGANVTADHQYLLVFGLAKHRGTPIAQFFVGTKWVKSETIDNDTETVALLIDAPGPGRVPVRMRLAANDSYAVLGITGIEGFII
jgi:hypothetical protein